MPISQGKVTYSALFQKAGEEQQVKPKSNELMHSYSCVQFPAMIQKCKHRGEREGKGLTPPSPVNFPFQRLLVKLQKQRLPQALFDWQGAAGKCTNILGDQSSYQSFIPRHVAYTRHVGILTHGYVLKMVECLTQPCASGLSGRKSGLNYMSILLQMLHVQACIKNEARLKN